MSTKIRFRLVLPLAQLILAIGLFLIGQAEYDRIRWAAFNARTNRQGQGGEGLPDIYKRARYVDYAINAPAWVAQGNTPWILNINTGVTLFGLMGTERDWWYMLYVVLMWYWIGRIIDNRFNSRASGESSPPSWKRRTVGGVCLAYGLFMIYTHPTLGPTRQYENWFIASVFVWGIGLVIVGASGLFSNRPLRLSAPVQKSS